ncbi:MAG: SDR family NAD(P)-dependent oxidoreductase [Pseudomonadota bacterium]
MASTSSSPPKSALIVGAGLGISASFARLLREAGYDLTLSSRTPDKIAELSTHLGASTIACNAADDISVEALFSELDNRGVIPDVVLYNPSYRVRGPLLELVPAEVFKTLEVTAYGGFLIAQAAAKRMVPRGSGAIFFTGASASMKGYAQSAPFAMGKFALRGLAQSMARELQPKGIHIAHFNIDGGVRAEHRPGRMEGPDDTPDSFLDPDAIAQTYMDVLKQHRSAWSLEVELRPWTERF